MMKIKLIIVVALLFIASINSYAQSIFSDSTGKKYLFVGGIRRDSLKVFADGKISWFSKNGLRWDSQLKTKEFKSLLFKNKLIINMEGDEPFWYIQINNSKLIYSNDQNMKKTAIDLEFSINVNDIDNTILIMFYSKAANVFGTLRSLTMSQARQNTCELCICEEMSIYEAFVSINGRAFKGCAEISKN